MAFPIYASPLERAWRVAYLTICTLIFIFLIAPIIIVIPLSFNAEPYFTFSSGMLHGDPAAYSLRWYDRLITFGMQNPEAPRDAGPFRFRCFGLAGGISARASVPEVRAKEKG